MASKYAHERHKARDRVLDSKKKNGERAPIETRSKEALEIRIGKYRKLGLSPAELIFLDLGYFFWAESNGVFQGWQQAEAEEIARKCRHIKPPKRKSTAWQFLLGFDKRDRLKSVELVTCSLNPPARRRQFLSKHLDLRWLLNPHRSYFACREDALFNVKQTLFGTQSPDKWQCKEFWAEDKNFAMECRQSHCPSIPRHGSFARPVPKYDGLDYHSIG